MVARARRTWLVCVIGVCAVLVACGGRILPAVHRARCIVTNASVRRAQCELGSPPTLGLVLSRSSRDSALWISTAPIGARPCQANDV